MRKKSIISIIVSLVIALSSVIVVCATPSLTTSTSERNSIANNWTYYSQGIFENNCLAYSMGNTTQWIWPWGEVNPTLSQARSYMSTLGYSSYDKNHIGPTLTCQIMAYGWDSSITHFSRITSDTSGSFSNGQCIAKWGHAEIFSHSTLDPYTNVLYGPSICKFRK